MIKGFKLADGSLVPADVEGSPIRLYINPDAAERTSLRETFNIDSHTLSSALDPDEVARIELNPEHLLLIWKRPTNYSGGDTFFFDVASIGMLLLKERLVIIVTEEIELIDPEARPKLPLRRPIDVMLALLLGTIHHYLGHLKVIKAIARDVEQKIQASMENQHLIQMFNLSESLIYYINAINSNGAVLTRLRNHAEKQGFAPEAVAFIDDLIIENNQCYKQAEIYSTVFSGLMDARGNLVNNNMNVLLRKLTLINVVFLPLNLIAGIGGMSEFTMMTRGVDWRISYALFFIAIVLIGYVTALVLRKLSQGSPIRIKRRREKKKAPPPAL